MKHGLDVKITKNSVKKINESSADDFLEKHVKSSETNPEKKDKEIFMPKISGNTIGVMSVIVGVNLISDILQFFVGSFKVYDVYIFICSFFKISTQTNVLAVLLVVLLIINDLFKKKK